MAQRSAAKSGQHVPSPATDQVDEEDYRDLGCASRPAAPSSSGKPGTRKRGKFNNARVEYKGMKFDSKVELRRYRQLEDMQERGEIRHLERQVRFGLYAICLYDGEESFLMSSVAQDRNAEKVCDYIADFMYHRGDESLVVEDVKGGPVTDVFKLKAKMFRACYGFDIKVVRLGRV